jgi:hypothetical protein
MSEPNSPGTEKTGPAKKRVSPARYAIGVVVLIGMLVLVWVQYSAIMGYNAAVSKLDLRIKDEDKGLASVQEAENLLGKSSDGPGVDVKENNLPLTKKTYTWQGLLKSYTLTAFFTKGSEPGLHHIETEGEKYSPEVNPTVPNTTNEPPVTAKTKMERRPGMTKPDSAPAKTSTEPVATKTDTEPVATKSTEPVPAKTTTEPVATKSTEPVPAKTTTEPAPPKTPN